LRGRCACASSVEFNSHKEGGRLSVAVCHTTGATGLQLFADPRLRTHRVLPLRFLVRHPDASKFSSVRLATLRVRQAGRSPPIASREQDTAKRSGHTPHLTSSSLHGDLSNPTLDSNSSLGLCHYLLFRPSFRTFVNDPRIIHIRQTVCFRSRSFPLQQELSGIG
jgi:hypothetical protein